MPANCSFKFCRNDRNNKRKDKSIRGVSLFQVTPKVVELWNSQLDKKHAPLKRGDVVCSRHFRTSDILYYDETILPDKTIHRIERIKPRLKKGAVPCIFEQNKNHNKNNKQKHAFSDTPVVITHQYVHSTSERRNTQNDIPHLQTLRAESVVIADINVDYTEQNEQQQNQQDTDWSFEMVESLQLPPGWLLCDTPNEKSRILVHVVTNQPIVHVDKSIRFGTHPIPDIQIKGMEYTTSPEMPICSRNDAEALLVAVDKLKVCCGAGLPENKSDTVCEGVVTKGNQKRCSVCTNTRNKMLRRQKSRD